MEGIADMCDILEENDFPLEYIDIRDIGDGSISAMMSASLSVLPALSPNELAM